MKGFVFDMTDNRLQKMEKETKDSAASYIRNFAHHMTQLEFGNALMSLYFLNDSVKCKAAIEWASLLVCGLVLFVCSCTDNRMLTVILSVLVILWVTAMFIRKDRYTLLSEALSCAIPVTIWAAAIAASLGFLIANFSIAETFLLFGGLWCCALAAFSIPELFRLVLRLVCGESEIAWRCW